MKPHSTSVRWLAHVGGMAVAFATCTVSVALAADAAEHPKSSEVFDYTRPILFQDNFASGRFGRWRFSENADYGIQQPHADRIAIVAAPQLPAGTKAVRFTVPRAPNSFRSELALPYEEGGKERWYAERLYVPPEWVIDDEKGDDIVMQWHAISGNWRATFPNLSISISGRKWWIKQNFGNAQDGPTRTARDLADPVVPGRWVTLVVHAKWSDKDDGFVRIWKDGREVYKVGGPNIYTTIGVRYTPYMKTGIYHPTWNLKTDERREAFAKAGTRPMTKIVYVTDVKVGDERARYEDVAPRADAGP